MSDLVYVHDGEIIEKNVGPYAEAAVFDAGITSFFSYTISNSQLLPGWWRHDREGHLQKAVVENDFLSMVVWNLSMMLEALPYTVRPRNAMVNAHFKLAEMYDAILRQSLNKIAPKLILDMLIHDLGGYAVIESDTSWSRALSNIPTGLTHLPVTRITVNPNDDKTVYPIYYRRKRDEKWVKVHESRLIKLTQLPFGTDEESIVGLSFVSRAFNVAEIMRNVNLLSLEQLGGKEAKRIVYGTDTSSKEIARAFKRAGLEAHNTGKTRDTGNVYLGMRDASAKVGLLDLKRFPQGFDWEKFVRTAAQLLAMAAGVDVNDLMAMNTAGTTKTAALVSDLKSSRKLYSWYCNTLKRQVDEKFLHRDLEFVVGDAQNNISETQAKTFISLTRATKTLVDAGTVDGRTSREMSLKQGLITTEQLAEMEMQEGRLLNGLSVVAVFFKNEQGLQKFLTLPGFEKPWMLDDHEPDNIIPAITEKVFELMGEVVNAQTKTRHNNSRLALAAYEHLLEEYEALALEAQRIAAEEAALAAQTELVSDSQLESEESDDSEDEVTKEWVIVNGKRRKKKKKRKTTGKKATLFSKTTVKGRNNHKLLKSVIREGFKRKELDTEALLEKMQDILVDEVDEDDLQDILFQFEDLVTEELVEQIKTNKLTHTLDIHELILEELDL